MSMPLMEKDHIFRANIFSTSYLHLMLINNIGHSALKCSICLWTYTIYFMYNKRMGRVNYTVVYDGTKLQGFLFFFCFFWECLVLEKQFWSYAPGSLFSGHLLSFSGTHRFYLYLPFPIGRCFCFIDQLPIKSAALTNPAITADSLVY